ncbi:hypothetical protein SteCoe_14238 [Stentor coeruleus]|uniref:Uncharacterized protein n=1 Tax=Stentor coeruleus TaxID=5963 RepID=A0A1R2C6I6_9CILI|nr:hypothetical protein SteCoe_14238 [Stentor coeruleus]
MFDERFTMASSNSNPKLHEFYRVYFDKAPRKKQDRILIGNKPPNSYPNLSSSLDKFSNRLPKLGKSVHQARQKEGAWDDNFHVKVSKDNLNIYKDCREYFDNPMKINYKNASLKTIRSPLIQFSERSKKASLPEKFFWSSLYEPISERNVVKHSAQRIYFS